MILTALLIGGYVLTHNDVRVPFEELPKSEQAGSEHWRSHKMTPFEKIVDIDPDEQIGATVINFLKSMPIGGTIDGGWGEESYVKVWVNPDHEDTNFENNLMYSATALMAFSSRTTVVTFDSYTMSYTVTRDDLTKVLLRDPTDFRSMGAWERIRGVIPDIRARALKKIPLPLAIDRFS